MTAMAAMRAVERGPFEEVLEDEEEVLVAEGEEELVGAAEEANAGLVMTPVLISVGGPSRVPWTDFTPCRTLPGKAPVSPGRENRDEKLMI